MKLKVGRVFLAILVVAIVIILIVSGAVQINLLRAWEWVVTGVQAMPGKILDLVSPQPKDFVVLVVGGVLGYLIKGAIIKHSNS